MTWLGRASLLFVGRNGATLVPAYILDMSFEKITPSQRPSGLAAGSFPVSTSRYPAQKNG